MSTTTLPRLALASAAVLVGLVGLGACSSDDESGAGATTTEESETTTTVAETTTTVGETTTTAEPAEECEPVAETTLALITPALEGSPAPTIAKAQTASFMVGGDEGRIIVVEFAGPGLDGETAVFAVGPSGTIYAADAVAQEFSSLEDLDLGSEWDESIDTVKGCLEGA